MQKEAWNPWSHMQYPFQSMMDFNEMMLNNWRTVPGIGAKETISPYNMDEMLKRQIEFFMEVQSFMFHFYQRSLELFTSEMENSEAFKKAAKAATPKAKMRASSIKKPTKKTVKISKASGRKENSARKGATTHKEATEQKAVSSASEAKS